MSCSLYVTRADSIVESLSAPITFDEWLSFVANDNSLIIEEDSQDTSAIWTHSTDPEPYYSLHWFEGSISADITSNEIIKKLLEISTSLGAHVIDDEGNRYSDDSGYPENWKPTEQETSKTPWWKF